jgi:hypothetical protein
VPSAANPSARRAAARARVARHRAARRQGMACYSVWLHDELVLEALAQSGVPDSELARRETVARAIAELVEEWARRRLKNFV